MKSSRNLEIFCGLLFSISLLVYSYFIDFPLANRMAGDGNVFVGNYWSYFNLLMVITWVLGVPVASYLHASKESYAALGLLVVLSGLYVLLTLLVVVLGPAFKGHHWTAATPSFFALSTMVIAGFNTISSLRKKPSSMP